MVDNSKKDSSADWPEEIKQAYEHLKIPSLYDAVIANEKLSLEIRRQDRELKTISEGIQLLTTQLNHLLEVMEEEWEEYEGEEEEKGPQPHFIEVQSNELSDLELALLKENQIYIERQSYDILIETHDEMRELSTVARQSIHQILALLPQTEGLIPHKPTWHPIVEGMLQNLIEIIEKSRYQFLTRLKESQIELIDPQPGEVLNKSLHHVIDRLSGGKTGTVAQVIRVGYRQNENVLRMADVTVYQ